MRTKSGIFVDESWEPKTPPRFIKKDMVEKKKKKSHLKERKKRVQTDLLITTRYVLSRLSEWHRIIRDWWDGYKYDSGISKR